MLILTNFKVGLMKTGNFFGVEFSGQVHNLNLLSRILKHKYILGI